MPRPLFIALIATLCFTCTTRAEDPDPTKLPAVKKALDKAEADVRRNRKAYDDANAKAVVEAEKELRGEVDRLSKAGKPEEAVAVKRLLRSLGDRVVVRAEKKTAPLPQKPLLETLEGRWDRTNDPHQWHFYLNGTAESRQDEGTLNLRGRIAVISADTFEVAWDNGWKDRCFVSGDVMTILRSFNPQGQREGTAYALERIK